MWDVEADNAALDEEFSVEVYGRVDSKSSTQVANETEKEKPEKVKGEGISVGEALAMSAILPGLGNRAVKGSGAQWLLGVAGYGCIMVPLLSTVRHTMLMKIISWPTMLMTGTIISAKQKTMIKSPKS